MALSGSASIARIRSAICSSVRGVSAAFARDTAGKAATPARLEDCGVLRQAKRRNTRVHAEAEQRTRSQNDRQRNSGHDRATTGQHAAGSVPLAAAVASAMNLLVSWQFSCKRTEQQTRRREMRSLNQLIGYYRQHRHDALAAGTTDHRNSNNDRASIGLETKKRTESEEFNAPAVGIAARPSPGSA
jgi:hypothetical protein